MSTLSQLRKVMQAKTIRALTVGFLLGLLALPAQAGIDIELLQRELQARFHYLTEGNYIVWPPCACQATPLYPPKGFYGDLDHDTLFATALVQDLADEFFAYRLHSIGYHRTSLYTITDDSLFNNLYDYQLYLFWLDTDGDLDGANSTPDSYSDDDFPLQGTLQGSAFDFTNITADNYTNCFLALSNYINKLVYIRLGDDVLTGVDTNNYYDYGKVNMSQTTTDSCDAAKQLGRDLFAFNSRAGYSSYVRTWSGSDTETPINYFVEKQAVRSRPFCNPTWAPGIWQVYLSAMPYRDSGIDLANRVLDRPVAVGVFA
jgi:hypothetical protein